MDFNALVDREQFLADSDGIERSRTSNIALTRMLGALDLDDERQANVLEVGTGSGYVAAVLGKLSDRVYTLETNPDKAARARRRLAEHANVQVVEADGSKGLADAAPFDAILVSARVPRVPVELQRQLAVGGRLVAPVGLYRVRQRLVRVTRTEEGEFLKEDLGELRYASELGEILLAIGAVGAEDLAEARASEEALEDVLLGRGKLREADLVMARGLQSGLDVGDVDQLLLGADRELLERLNQRYLQKGNMLPLKLEDGALTVATTDPNEDPQTIALHFRASRVKTWLVSETDFKRLRAALELDRQDAVDVDPGERPPELMAEGVTNAHVRLFETLLLEAIGQGASDIHLERYGDATRVRLRVDGVLEDATRFSLTRKEHEHIVNILKVSAGMDITEHFLPQGGRFSRSVGNRSVDLRAQVQPSFDGENAVIRLLLNAADAFHVSDLGFTPEVQRAYDRLLEESNGLVLVTGPTGSGKTTTLYAALQKFADDKTRKVLTIEDPVEYAVYGVQQIQTRRRFGFGEAMKSFVRQDPDVVLLGEIRDPETALETIRASQTGHLVLSTVHCNDAVGAVQRLRDLGMGQSSIASELMAVFSQRLVRRNCPNCRAAETPDAWLLEEFFPGGVPKDITFVAGRGCVRCRGRGTLGRVPVVELWAPDAAIRAAVARGVPVPDLRKLSVDRGMVRLPERGLELVRQGEVSLRELRRQLSAEQLEPLA